jgi:hypothetical protein
MIQVEIEQLAATLAVIAVEPFDPHPLGKDATSLKNLLKRSARSRTGSRFTLIVWIPSTNTLLPDPANPSIEQFRARQGKARNALRSIVRG